MNFKATIQLALFPISLLITSLCFSQEKKESVPVVIVEGIVKLKGKAVNNATLTLNKDGKQVAKLITPRNGIYHFELNKSNNNPQNSYKIEIVKEGTVNGVVTINTYIPPEQFTPVPYLYNLDFNLIDMEAANGAKKKDYGLIHWFIDKKVFDFDKDYVPPVEVDPAAENLAKKADSIKAAEEKILLAEKAAAEEKRKADSLLAATNNNPDKADKIVQPDKDTKNNKTANAAKTTDAKNKTTASTSDVAKNQNTGGRTNTTNTNANQTSVNNTSQFESSHWAANKDKTNTATTTNKAQQSTGTNSKTSASTNNTGNTNNTGSVGNVSSTTSNKTSSVGSTSNTLSSVTTAKGQSETMGQNIGNSSVAENTQTEPQSPKDLFFLTGVPMEQFKRNSNTDNSRDYDNFYSTEELMYANNEHNRILSLKEKMERKRAENSAKKLETNNTLTSLLDEVTEFEKRNKKQQK